MNAPLRLMLTLLAGAWLAMFAMPAQAQRLNEFGPTGSMCRAACGPDCPDTCDKRSYNECISPQAYRRVNRYTCGTHQGCRDHDFCLDNCARQGVAQTGLDFLVAECNRECHMLAHAYAIDLFGKLRGTQVVDSWRRGHGPYSGRMTWLYTIDKPGGKEKITYCPSCAVCRDGRCFVVDQDRCEPCNTCGDVHIRSLDGLRFDFQSSGDFILVDSPDGLRIETRQVPYGRGVSVNSAVAVRSGGQVVRVSMQPERRVEIDGQALPGPGAAPLAGGGELKWDEDTVFVQTADGWKVAVRLFGSFLNVAATPPDAMRGRVSGLLGNADGDPENDLVGRDGTAYPTTLTEEALYEGFGASWRLPPDQSLLAGLPWPEGVPKAGSGRPESLATLAGLEPMARWEAEQACAEAGLEGLPNFDACVLDFAITGDREMLDSAVLSAEGSKDVTLLRRARSERPLAEGEVAVQGPARAVAGSRIEVLVAGAFREDDLVALLPVEEAADPPPANTARVGNGDAIALLVPPEPGAYRLAYLAYPGREVRAEQAFEVQPLQVGIRAPARAPAGHRLEVALEGIGQHTDLLVVAAADAAPGDYENHARRGRDDVVELLMPSRPGRYEIRYLIDQRRHLVARHAIEVEPRQVSLQAPVRARVGSQLRVELQGDGEPTDLVVVAAVDAPPARYEQHVRRGEQDAVRLLMPSLPGNYELRYLIDQDRQLVDSRPIEVEPLRITLQAPESALAGARLEVQLEGEGNAGDLVVVVPVGAPDTDIGTHARVGDGEAGRLVVLRSLPETPGRYEIRYLIDRGRVPVARRPLRIDPPGS